MTVSHGCQEDIFLAVGARLARYEWASRIRALRVDKLKLSQPEFAARLGFPQAQAMISRWESGEKRPTPENFIALANISEGEDRLHFWEEAGLERWQLEEAFEASVHARKPPARARIRAVEYPAKIPPQKTSNSVELILLSDPVAAGPPAQVQERDVERVITMPTFLIPHPDETVCVRVKGESMAPTLQEGFICAVDTRHTNPMQLVEHMVAARDPEGGVTIKWLRKMDSGALILVPQHTSPRYPILTFGPEWSIVGRVCCWIGTPPKR
jgi:transcriptional regulator with XRE-family HTH domain